VEPALKAAGVRKTYSDVVALDGVDLQLAPGEIVGLLGPNGAGKTTLVSIVAGLRRPDAGSVSVCGIDVLARPDAARCHLGLAPQDLGIYPSLTVRDNLTFFGELAGLRKAALRSEVDEVAEALDLTRFLPRLARLLSGGEKRRLHTAMALLGRPRLLLLDEPTSGVDVATRAQLLEVVRRLAADGAAVCYSTHYLPEVEALDASVAMLLDGRVIARGTVATLVAAHGGCAVEFAFDGPAPAIELDGQLAERDGTMLRMPSERPAATTAALLARLGADSQRLASIEIVRPNLESVFLALTGRRYREDETEGQEAAHVGAA